MAQIKHPKSGDSLTPQVEGDRRHVRGTSAKDYDQAAKSRQEAGGPHNSRTEEAHTPSGPDARDAMGGRRDLDANPGIGSSGGTTDSGESGLSRSDRGAGINRTDR
ncbi:hypothetical protein [Azospirillum sp. A39]|uniref:hypothetical protein n=1 Tax=Azospirillum sp. A39 TaxID=3462279 RepID=UPI004046454C